MINIYNHNFHYFTSTPREREHIDANSATPASGSSSSIFEIPRDSTTVIRASSEIDESLRFD